MRWSAAEMYGSLFDLDYDFQRNYLSRQDAQFPISTPAETKNEGSREEQSSLSVWKHESVVKMESEADADDC